MVIEEANRRWNLQENRRGGQTHRGLVLFPELMTYWGGWRECWVLVDSIWFVFFSIDSSFKSNLNYHTKRHNSDEYHHCTVCGQSFTNNGSLKLTLTRAGGSTHPSQKWSNFTQMSPAQFWWRRLEHTLLSFFLCSTNSDQCTTTRTVDV